MEVVVCEAMGVVDLVVFLMREKLKCEHYGHFHHTKDICWDLHGRLVDVPFRSSTSRGCGGNRSGGSWLSAIQSLPLLPLNKVMLLSTLALLSLIVPCLMRRLMHFIALWLN